MTTEMDLYTKRYLWLLANMGRVEKCARLWRPELHKPLLIFLQDFIDDQITKESPSWFKKQAALLQGVKND